MQVIYTPAGRAVGLICMISCSTCERRISRVNDFSSSGKPSGIAKGFWYFALMMRLMIELNLSRASPNADASKDDVSRYTLTYCLLFLSFGHRFRPSRITQLNIALLHVYGYCLDLPYITPRVVACCCPPCCCPPFLSPVIYASSPTAIKGLL